MGADSTIIKRTGEEFQGEYRNEKAKKFIEDQEKSAQDNFGDEFKEKIKMKYFIGYIIENVDCLITQDKGGCLQIFLANKWTEMIISIYDADKSGDKIGEHDIIMLTISPQSINPQPNLGSERFIVRETTYHSLQYLEWWVRWDGRIIKKKLDRDLYALG